MRILGIDTSCDDTSAAVVENGRAVLSSVVTGQDSVHGRYGGIVPELASRRHVQVIDGVVREALADSGIQARSLDAVAVCNGPGLVGSLLVGLLFAKGFCLRTHIPLVSVNHLEGHVFASFLEAHAPEFPFLALVVSGGHTSLYDIQAPGMYREIGRTRDDAAGEAYDKVAKLMGLGYPGGAILDGLARTGNAGAVRLPRPFPGPSPDFSFSGLKTAVMNLLNEHRGVDPSDLAASFQQRVVDVLVEKTLRAAQRLGRSRVVLSGGVAANSGLREAFVSEGGRKGVETFLPSVHFCTDNAAMIAAAAYWKAAEGKWATSGLQARAAYPLTSWARE